MLVSTKGRYALRFLIDLAEHDAEGPVSLKSIAERQGISKKYLERIVACLNPSGMLQITRGYQGGYRLNRDPSMITIAEILQLTEGGFSPVPAEELERGDASTTFVWESLEGAITRCLENMTLEQAADASGRARFVAEAASSEVVDSDKAEKRSDSRLISWLRTSGPRWQSPSRVASQYVGSRSRGRPWLCRMN